MAETGTRDSGRFRDDFGKVWNDLYYGNGKPGITTRIQILEDGMERMEQVAKELNVNVANLTMALHGFKGGASVAKHSVRFVNWALGAAGAALILVINHYWK